MSEYIYIFFILNTAILFTIKITYTIIMISRLWGLEKSKKKVE